MKDVAKCHSGVNIVNNIVYDLDRTENKHIDLLPPAMSGHSGAEWGEVCIVIHSDILLLNVLLSKLRFDCYQYLYSV